MNESINKYLVKGEEVLWTGKPVKTKFFDEDVKTSYLAQLIITGCVCVFLVAGYFALCAKNNANVMIGMVGVIVLLCCLPVSSIFTVWRSLGKLSYVITNQRAIIWLSCYKMLSLPLTCVDAVVITRGKNGMDSLCIGSPACKLAAKKLRGAGVDSVRVTQTDNETVTYPVFYNIQDAETAKAILESLL